MTATVSAIKPKHLDQLIAASQKERGVALGQMDWPESIPDDAKWISDELLTVYDTEWARDVPPETLHRLRKWESINFYAQNVHGERTLTRDLVARLYTAEYSVVSPYLFHFVREENEHMAMFAEFCNRYGEILPSLRIDLGRRQEPLVEEFLLFCRTILFEYYVDYYNRTAARDASLPSIVREINRRHHLEEARHLGFSRSMIQALFERLKETLDEAAMDAVARYVEEYTINQIELVYSTRVYELAGIPAPSEFRKRLLQHPGRRAVHLDWIQQSYDLFRSIGLLGKRSPGEIIDAYFLPQQEALAKTAVADPKSAIRDWLRAQAGEGATVTDSSDLLEEGVVDSLAFMRFLVFIEQVSGKEIRLDEIDLDDVRSLNAIEKAFLR